ncbi:glycosyltransferase [Rubrimonas cliftonensis]|uniref:Glycosyl transferases group 1 n=1 Tax=Rubrimonas cliftonensis TaxID=89524 RepID=A0A1H4CYA4_9RHOB|nr:glycosyltransferase [Rubrimonas cliftonensis]SEA65310.1 Glycosyl transferases group 1 [Rubrimonas cliftonensis]
MAGRLTAPPLPVETPRALFDVSRLLRQRARAFGTGVDRIDLAIGLDLAARFGPDCLFVHAAPAGPALLPHAVGAAALRALARRWGALPAAGDAKEPDADPSAPRGLARALLAGAVRGAAGGFRALAGPDVTYVVASHSGLPAERGGIDRVDPGRRMRRLAYIHDVIPLEYPEYQTPRSARRFERFLAALGAAPTRYVANSADTARRLGACAAARGWAVEGIDALPPRLEPGPPPRDDPAPRPAVRAILDGAAPWFIAIGTIEPRKNHLLLLQLWRALAEAGTPPRLAVVGRRGWENEMVVDMLDRCAAIAPHVSEFGDLSDAETLALLKGARALLFPSFAEGLGLPLMEAAAVGTPAIVSDLPVFREIAPPGTVFLDPLDGPGWARAIRARLG